jgi:hypothetical protein
MLHRAHHTGLQHFINPLRQQQLLLLLLLLSQRFTGC